MDSGDTKTPKNDESDGVRKALKVKIMQLQADELQKKMDDAMNNIEHMAQEYAALMAELQELKGVSESQNKKHIELLSRMMGEQGKTPVDYDSCNTSEEMLQLVMNELDQVKTLEAKMKEQEDVALPDVGDNSEIWDRIAQAQKAVKEEEKNKLFTSTTSPLAVLTDAGEDNPQTRPPTPSTPVADMDSDSSDLSLSSNPEADQMSQSLFITGEK